MKFEDFAPGSDTFSHSEFMALALNTISEIVRDPLLKDLHSEPSVEEVNSQIALEHGRAITVNVVQQDEENTVLREFLYWRFIHINFWKMMMLEGKRVGGACTPALEGGAKVPFEYNENVF